MTFTLAPELPRTRTPCDYTRIHFDPAEVPDRRIVGLLACQRDPLLRKLRTRVHAASHFKEAIIPKRSKADKGGAKAIDVTSGKLWEVELLDTVIFPEGGGQPADNGTLTFIQAASSALDGQELRVEAAYRRSLHALHLVRVPEDLEDAFASIEGLEVEVEVDWDRRMDHMSIHTAQHLLSSVFEQEPFNLPTLSWGLPAFPSLDPPYIELERGVTWKEAADVEKRCNELIEEDRRVWIDVTMQGQTPNEGVDERFDRESRGIPKDYDGGVIRAVNIEDQDRNLCCGTQVPQLSMCRMVHVIPPSCAPDATKPSTVVPTRLYFHGGPRAQRALIEASVTLSTAAQALACSRSLVVDKVNKLDEIKLSLTRKEKGLKSEVIRLIANELAKQHSDAPAGVIWQHRSEESTHDFDFMNTVAGTVRTTLLENGTLEASLPTVVMTSAVAGSPGLITITASPATASICKSLGDEIKAGLEALAPELGGKRVKGGGAKGKWMAKAEGKWGKSETSLIDEVIAKQKAA